MAGRPHSTLPRSFTRFIDREAELGQILGRLSDPACRLLTITGPSGVGKTRLAIEAAGALLSLDDGARFADGVYYLDLAAVAGDRAPDNRIAMAVADACGLVFAGPDEPALEARRHLRPKAMLLVLDNVQQQIEAGRFIAGLLDAAPRLAILATSHEPINLQGECIIALEGLAFPADDDPGAAPVPGQYDAIELFRESARAVAPDFAPEDENAAAIARICRLVRGLPMAVELAASLTPMLAPAAIAAEIALNLDFLTTYLKNLPEREHSLRAVFASAWARLTSEEQQALRRLEIFRGDFTSEAAAAITGARLPALAALVDKSFVRCVTTGTGGTAARYALVEPMRRYAAEQLACAGEATATAERHAAYYLARVEACRDELRGPNHGAALEAFEADLGQIRAAWQWAIDQADGALPDSAAEGLFRLYKIRGRFNEGAALAPVELPLP